MEAPTRDQLVTDWVSRRFPDQSVQITPASADASFRRYFRLAWPDGSTRILMDAPPDKDDCKPFIHVASLLKGAGPEKAFAQAIVRQRIIRILDREPLE